MNKNLQKSDIDKLGIQLLQSYSSYVCEKNEDNAPFFISQLRNRIKKEQQLAQYWEFGVISARKWLVVLCFVALLIFLGNLVAISTQSSLFNFATQSSLSESDDRDFVHSGLETLNVDESQ